MMTDNLCQLCRNRLPDTRFHVCCNGMLCPSCHAYSEQIKERNKPVPASEVLPQAVSPTAPRQVPLPTAPPAGNAPPPPQLRPNTPGIQRTRVTGPASRPVPLTGSFNTPEIYNTLTGGGAPTIMPVRSPIIQQQPMPTSPDILPCEICEDEGAVEVARHHTCDTHFVPPPIAGGSGDSDGGEPPKAYVVMLAQQDPLSVQCLGVFPVLVEAENCVRARYLRTEYGIESPGDAMLRPEHYGMSLAEVQAMCAEADEAILQAGTDPIALDEAGQCVRISMEEIK
jgi:hypothetical protein